jgi:hypothetical protein
MGRNISYHRRQFYPKNDLQGKISEYIRRFGAFIFFSFIEATRPFKDDSLSLAEREFLVSYWAQNAIPLDDMFAHFQAAFEKRNKDRHWNTPLGEMNEERINKLLEAMKRAFPREYDDLLRGRNEPPNKKKL